MNHKNLRYIGPSDHESPPGNTALDRLMNLDLSGYIRGYQIRIKNKKYYKLINKAYKKLGVPVPRVSPKLLKGKLWVSYKLYLDLKEVGSKKWRYPQTTLKMPERHHRE